MTAKVTFASVVILAVTLAILAYRMGAEEHYTTLALEDRTTLHVGQKALLPIPKDHHYKVVNEGAVLALVRRSKAVAVFRAVQSGQETILLSPDVAKGECVACATHHYFVTVVSQSD